MEPAHYSSITALRRAYDETEVTPSDAVEYFLDRIRRRNPDLNAFITVTSELARHQAQVASRMLADGRASGGLVGIPVAVKDFYDTAGVPTTAGFEHFGNRIPAQDAAIVARLRAAGAVLLGKTNMHRLGMGTTSLNSASGPVRNPIDPRFVAGGSSGGSAAAVAAGLCLATIDTDAVGSGRLPAAICGVTCFKPGFGLLSTVGILEGEAADPVILMLSHGCITARNAPDAELLFEALAGNAGPLEPVAAEVRLGVVSNYFGTQAVRSAFESAVEEMKAITASLRQVEVPFAAATFGIGRIVEDRANAQATVFGGADILMLPTLTAGAPAIEDAEGDEMAVSPQNTFFANYFGLPAITVPYGRDENGLPLGLQLVGKPGADRQVLHLAGLFQALHR